MARLTLLLKVAGVLALAALVLGTVLGQPLLLSYVETGSMEPTLEAGDGFVAVPTALSGEPEVGDVVVFRAQELHGGGLVTHRIVDRTERGYVTRGDDNPFTDQDGGEPPVPRERILATALQVNGQVLVLPKVGLVFSGLTGGLDWGQRRLAAALGTRALLGTSGVGYLLVGIGALLVGAAGLGGERAVERSRSRSRRREGVYSPLVVTLLLCGMLVVPATGAMVLGGDSHTVTVTTTDRTISGTVSVPPGESRPVEYRVPNDTPLPTVVAFEPTTDGVTIEPSHGTIAPGAERRVVATLSGPGSEPRVERSFVEHRYLPVLPPAAIVALHEVHPLLALAAVDATLLALVAALATGLLGSRPLRLRSRGRTSR
ncbi:signal peptidase I [Halorientalis halophila]|uniref:signal peptidase I n=1 Tax=Halorientalis halophila TaxID=3108499 RepID=UPI003008723D